MHGPSYDLYMGHCAFILDWSSVHGISMYRYVKTYLDLSLSSRVVLFVTSWPVHLEARRVPSCRSGPYPLFACFVERLLL